MEPSVSSSATQCACISNLCPCEKAKSSRRGIPRCQKEALRDERARDYLGHYLCVDCIPFHRQ